MYLSLALVLLSIMSVSASTGSVATAQAFANKFNDDYEKR
jgi:hypothetical protein